jgi:hypothetical protein
MGGFSQYWENEVLDHLFDKGIYMPPTVYVALSAADPGEDGSGVAEPAGGFYMRVCIGGADWSAACDGAIVNVDTIEFGQATAPWGTITHFALYDAEVGGHLLACGPLTTPAIVAAGDVVRFSPGDLCVTLD